MYKTVAPGGQNFLKLNLAHQRLQVGMVMYDVIPKNAATLMGKRTAE